MNVRDRVMEILPFMVLLCAVIFLVIAIGGLENKYNRSMQKSQATIRSMEITTARLEAQLETSMQMLRESMDMTARCIRAEDN
jgi:sensor domain CHASE-containing protein